MLPLLFLLHQARARGVLIRALSAVEEPKTGERPAPLRVVLWKRHDVNLGKTGPHFGANRGIIVYENKGIERQGPNDRLPPADFPIYVSS